MLVITAPLIFFDTSAYLNMGEQSLEFALSLIFPASEGGDAGAALGQEVRAVRAVTYSVFLALFSKSLLGLALPVLIQTALMLILLRPYLAKVNWHLHSSIAFVVLTGFSTLPWVASFAMPDILTATIIVWSALLLGFLDRLSMPHALMLTAIATFATSSHYGHIPLALVLIACVGLLRLFQRRISWRFVLLGPAPALIAMMLNFSTSAIALDAPSFAPKRLPILLARSLEDGPAAWYLEENCPEAGFTMCEVFGNEMPENISEFLWHPDGIKSVSTATLDAIRAEERSLLLAAFRTYPTAQLWSFGRNTVLQLFTVGTDDIHPVSYSEDLPGVPKVGKPTGFQKAVLTSFDWITNLASVLGFAMVIIFWSRGRLNAAERDLALMIILGLIINALIFGGLSAPVDRYQTRIIWLFPALWFFHVARQKR